MLLPRLAAGHFTPAAEGAKAAALHQLATAGFPVPAGFIIPAEVALSEVARKLETAVASVGGFPVAVRSSGSLEDLSSASFAGQYITTLDVRNAPDLLDSVIACRESASSPQVQEYLRRNNLSGMPVRVNALVQRMVNAVVSGVVFSIDPTTGREEHAVIECCHGRGDRLVAGHTSPTRYLVQLDNSGVLKRAAGAENVSLGDDTVRALCRLALHIQAHFGAPQDIEWVLDCDGKLWVLQSRPITRIHWRRDADGFTTASFREGVAARVCTPLMHSLYGTAFQNSMQRFFLGIKLVPRTQPAQRWIALYYGRPYWNAGAAKKALRQLPGFNENEFDADFGIHRSYRCAEPIRTSRNLRTFFPALPAVIALERNFQQQLRKTREYGERFQGKEALYLELTRSFHEIGDATFSRLLAAVVAFHQTTYSDYFTTVYYHTVCQGAFKSLIGQIATAINKAVSPVLLMGGLRNVSHMSIQRDFLRLVTTARQHGTDGKEWERALDDFLGANYFRADTELDISTPRWGESPGAVTRLVESVLRGGIEPVDPECSAENQSRQFSAEVSRVAQELRRNPWNWLRFGPAFHRRLKLARQYLSRKEQMREYSTRADHLVRRYVLEAGRRLHRHGWLADAEDVFMLNADELNPDPTRVTKAHCIERVQFRRLMYRAYRLLEPPTDLGVYETAATQWESQLQQGTVLNGIGCSAGRITAKARVVETIREASCLQAGEILVTRYTDPGWTAVLGRIAGVVTETGGQLSHGAVICREYGVPAVLSLPGATQLIKTGQLLEIDGVLGTVTILGHNARTYAEAA